MDAKLQLRIQRYGWDLAAGDYDLLWRDQLAPVQAALLRMAALAPGERVLDVACGTGVATLAAAAAVGPNGEVLGVDLSGRMVDTARRRAQSIGAAAVPFARMDAGRLDLPDDGFDVGLCVLGLMYLPDPVQALRELRRVLRPGGRLVLAVWGERSACGWSTVFPIVDEEVASEVCPLFFALGQGDALADACAAAGFEAVTLRRVCAVLTYPDGATACDAAFLGGPMALAWSRFDAEVRARVRRRYLDSIESWRISEGYELPGEFVLVAAAVPAKADKA